MHSNDPNKHHGLLRSAFWEEFERTLVEAGEGEAHLQRIIFPSLDLQDRTVSAECSFMFAIFTEGADFSQVTFKKRATFGAAHFQGKSNFIFSTFEQQAYFGGAKFDKEVNFASFFQDEALFDTTKYLGKVAFHSTCRKDVTFYLAEFSEDADFAETTFDDQVEFGSTIFHRNVDFREVSFKTSAKFNRMTVHGTADWRWCRFALAASFSEMALEPSDSEVAGAIFAHARFDVPDQIVFDEVDLTRVLFRDCDVSAIRFSPSVVWGKRGKRGWIIYDERLAIQQTILSGFKANSYRELAAVAQIYQQLKKNFDDRLDYWTADSFHFGEMEMKRQAAPDRGAFLGLRRWWHRTLSFVALYRWASDYGNSFNKPLLWLCGVVFSAASLFPLAGLQKSSTGTIETYSSVFRAGQRAGTSLRWEIGLIGKSLLAAVDAATFQKGADYIPAYPWGRTIAIGESLLTATLFALFLLAIRRQFRR